MKQNNLYTEDELELFESLENSIDKNTYKPMPKEELKDVKKHYQQVAENTIKKITKKRALNIRVYEEDIIESIKALALEKGLPYQTLLSSIIHQVATRQISI